MSELTFSKKQICPLMERYGIKESDKAFSTIIAMFKDQTNYQIWAIKLVYGGVCNLDVLKKIAEFAILHQQEIKNLQKGNIVSYKTNAEINILLNEIEGTEKLLFLRSWVNTFNTEQKNMLRKLLNLESIKPLSAALSTTINSWVETFKKLSLLPKHKRDKMISLASAINNADALKAHIIDATKETYEWEHDDMMAYLHNNANDCEVVFDKDNVVVITVPSFESSKKMCGKGRTSWCITRDKKYFEQYCIEPKNAHQYMLFNFNYPEYHDLAHIGFTVRDGEGITNAHSTTNNSLTSSIRIDGKDVNIHDALRMANVPKDIYVKLRELKAYEWTLESILKFVNEHKNDYKVILSKDGKLIVEILNNTGGRNIARHSFVRTDSIDFSRADGKWFVYFNTQVPYQDENSLYFISFNKDKYSTYSLGHVFDAYNINKSSSDILTKLGLTIRNFIDVSNVDPSILLHKYIDNKLEEEAIELLKKEGDKIDVNRVLENYAPIFNVIQNKMVRLFEIMVSNKNFNFNVKTNFNETIYDKLLGEYKLNGVTTREDDAITEHMIETILDSGKCDLNITDTNDDTPVNIACERPELLWVAKRLIENPSVNINVVNDFNCTALGNAIRKNNIEAIKLLANRPDLVVRVEDKELAACSKVKLSRYLPKEKLDMAPEPTREMSTTDLYTELFARVFKRSMTLMGQQ